MLKLIPILVVSCCLVLMYCSPDNPAGSSTTTHTKVAGIVKGPDKKVIEGAEVFLYPKQRLESGDEIPDDAKKAETDTDGKYEFDTVDRGEYYLKATYGDSLAKIDSLVIEKSDLGETVTKNLTLELTAIIIGSFNRSYIDNSLKQNVTNIYVYNFTTNQKTELNNDGTFTFTNVPKGMYQFVLVKDNEIVSSPLDSLLFDLLKNTDADTVYQYDIGGVVGALTIRCTAGKPDSVDAPHLEETVEYVVAVLERKNHIDSFTVSLTVKEDSLIIGTIDSLIQDSYLSLHIAVFDDDSVMIWQGTYDETFAVEDEVDTLELVLEKVVQLSISVKDQKVLIDRKFLPTVTFSPAEADTLEVVFSSADSEIVDIINDSLLALKADETEITATAGEARTTFTVTVVDDAFVISIADTTIIIGSRFVPEIVFDPEEADSETVEFTSDDEDIVKVDDDTLIAVETGSVEITAEAGEVRETFTVTVIDNTFKISINDDTVTVNTHFVPVVTFNPEEADSESVEFTSDDEDIVKVKGDTLIAAAEGTVEITAAAGEETATFTITVTDNSFEISIADTTVTTGERFGPVVEFDPDEADSESVTFTSENTDVVTVDGDTLVAVAAGTASVTAEAGNENTTFTVTVEDVSIEVTISVSDAAITEGNSFTPSITWTPADADSMGYTLTSLNTDIVTIDEGKVVGKETGTTSVVAKVNGSEVADTFTVSVRRQGGDIDTLWFEDFERDGAADDWTASMGTWEIGTPTAGPQSAYSGNNVAGTKLSGNYANSVNTYLVRLKSFTVPSADINPRLRFRTWYNNHDDIGRIYLKEKDSSSWVPIDDSLKITGSSDAIWTYPSYDLSYFAGKEVQLAFRFNSNSNGGYTGWYIDDIVIFTGPLTYKNPEGWEDGLGDWYVDYGTWEVGVPTYELDTAYSGKNVAGTKLSGKYGTSKKTRLISPPVQVPASDKNPALRFRHWFNLHDDIGRVQIREVGTRAWTTVSSSYTGSCSGVWTYPNIDLASYAGKYVQICFYLASNSNGGYSGWYIDDVVMLPVE